MTQETTQEEQVLIRGKVFLYRQKAPFVPSGASVHGALEYNGESDELRCHECGGWYRMLATHIVKAHRIRAAEYRKRHGLRRLCALCGPKMIAKIRGGERKEQYYQRLRERVRSPEGRASFAALARDWRARYPRVQPPTDLAERRNETGHCHAQLTRRLKELAAMYGGLPTNAELSKHGLSPESICVVFNLPTVTEVMKLLQLAPSRNRAGASAYTREVLIEMLRDFWAKYGCLPMRSHIRMGLVPRSEAFTRAFGSMAEAYEAAGLSIAAARSPHGKAARRKELIGKIQKFYQEHGDVPRASRKYGRGDGESLPAGFPSRGAIERLFGSMYAAYEAAGLLREFHAFNRRGVGAPFHPKPIDL